MKITENKLRHIIKKIILESELSENYSENNINNSKSFANEIEELNRIIAQNNTINNINYNSIADRVKNLEEKVKQISDHLLRGRS